MLRFSSSLLQLAAKLLLIANQKIGNLRTFSILALRKGKTIT